MSYDKIKLNLGEFDTVLQKLNLEITDEFPAKAQFDLVREFLTDQQSGAPETWLEKWKSRFDEFFHAMIVVDRLTDAVVVLKDQDAGRLRKHLAKVFSGSLTQDFEPNQAKDFMYELELAAAFKRAGFETELTEPDIRIQGNGLSRPLGVACKYPSSEAQINEHISKGYRQIAKHVGDGFVAVGIEQIALKDSKKFLDFRQGDRPPMETMLNVVSDVAKNLTVQRAEDYPAEKPLDGAVITLIAGGIYGKPAGIAILHALALQTDKQNPIFPDLEVIKRKLESLNKVPASQSAKPAG